MIENSIKILIDVPLFPESNLDNVIEEYTI